MLTLESLTHPSNILELTNPEAFLNTLTVAGCYYTPSDWCSDVPEHSDTVQVNVTPSYFSGFVFRGDMRTPMEIFETGFFLQTDTSDSHRTAMGATAGGTTGRTGISTSVCASACLKYSFQHSGVNPFSRRRTPVTANTGFVYLIDARELSGFAIPSPRPQSSIAVHNPCLRDVYEVNFVCNILGCKIVGIVWSMGGVDDGLKECRGYWVHRPSRLWLAVNPNYERKSPSLGIVETGMPAAKKVARRLNHIED